jgi:hypothetical protein
VTTAEWRRSDQLRADRETVNSAGVWLRSRAWQEQYAGCHDKDRCFQLAMLLDTLSLQLDRAPAGLREETVRVSWSLLGQRGA